MEIVLMEMLPSQKSAIQVIVSLRHYCTRNRENSIVNVLLHKECFPEKTAPPSTWLPWAKFLSEKPLLTKIILSHAEISAIKIIMLTFIICLINKYFMHWCNNTSPLCLWSPSEPKWTWYLSMCMACTPLALLSLAALMRTLPSQQNAP